MGSTAKAWADGPFELIETPEFAKKNAKKGPDADYIMAASYMALMHNTLIRGLNSIYQQAPHVAPADYKDFIGYSLCFCEVLENHTRGEDTYMVPEIEKATGEKGLMDFNKQEHDLFEPGLEAFKSYLLTLQASPSPDFSGQKLLSLISAFSEPLMAHLRSEIPALVSLSRFGTSLPILKISTTTGETANKALDKDAGFMWFLMNNDLTYEGGKWAKWPPIPSLVRWGMVKKNMQKNKGYWKFASCGDDGKPQTLFVGS